MPSPASLRIADIRTMMDDDPSARSSSDTRHAFTVLQAVNAPPGVCVNPGDPGCIPGAANGGAGALIDPAYKTPYALHASAGVQHAFGSKWMLSADYSEVRGVDSRQPPQVRQPRTCTHQEASTFSQPFHSRIYNSGGALPPGQTSMMANMRRARPPMTVPRRPAEAEEARRNGLARKLARRKRAGALLAPLQ